MGSQIYDDTIELQLNELICKLDNNPIICTDPVEDSSYLTIKLYTSEEGFQRMVEISYNQYLAYLDQFTKQNSISADGQTHRILTLNRLLAKYRGMQQQFRNSNLRLDWKILAKSFTIHNPQGNFNLKKKQEYTREAYHYFYKMSSIQMFFLVEIKKYLSQQLQSINSEGSQQIINSVLSTQTVNKPENYHFIIRPKATKDSHNILQYIHKHLKENEFINCTLPEFKQVFTSNKPIPIIWNKDYIQLSYLIKNLAIKFLLRSKSPSNYVIAIKVFYNKAEGVFFNPMKLRHDKDPNLTDKNIIDFIIYNSIDFFLKEY